MVKDNSKESVEVLEKIGQIEFEEPNFNGDDEVERAENNFELKKWSAEVWSDIPELNKDFTLSNLSDSMFQSKVTNFIRNRILLIKLLNNIYPYANRKLNPDGFELDESVKKRIIFETIEHKKNKNLILSDVYTILNLSKGRGGLVLKSFLEGGMSKEEMEVIAGEDGPAVGEPHKRGFMDRMLGRNRVSKNKPRI